MFRVFLGSSYNNPDDWNNMGPRAFCFFILSSCFQQAKEANATSEVAERSWLTADQSVQIRLHSNLGKLTSLLTVLVANKHN